MRSHLRSTTRLVAQPLLLALLFFTLSLSFGAGAGDRFRKNFEASLKIGDKTLVLNGRGIRKATVFRVKVYEAALYLEEKSKEPSAILESDSTKVMDFYFIRSVYEPDMIKAWKKAFEENREIIGGEIPTEAAKKFYSYISDSDQGDSLRLILMNPNTLLIKRNGVQLGVIKNPKLPKLVLATWIYRPPNESLKMGLLGQLPQ